MSLTHFHLVVTHLPVFGVALGILVVLYGMLTRSEQIKRVACLLLVLSSAGAVAAYLSGEGAEETVESIKGVSEQLIEEHEEAARGTLFVMIALGSSALAGYILPFFRSFSSLLPTYIILLISFVSLGMVSHTAYLGGQIRHSEIHNAVSGQDGEVTEEVKESWDEEEDIE